MNKSDYILIEKYLEGTASPEEFAVLEDRLRDNPETRLSLLQEAGFECQLRLLLKSSPELSTELAGDAEETESDEPSQVPSRRKTYWKPAWLWIPVAAAAAALLVALALPLLAARLKGQSANTGVASQNRPAGKTPAVAQHVEGQNDKDVNGPAPKSADGRVQPDTAAGVAVLAPENPMIVKQEPVTHVPANGAHLAGTTPAPLPAPRQTVQAGSPEKSALPGQNVQRKELYGMPIAMARPANDQPGNPVPNGADATASAAATPAVVAANAQPEVRIANLAGNVYLTRLSNARNARRLVQSGDAFLSGDTIETDSSSSGTLRYEDGTLVRFYTKTRLTLSSKDQTRSLQLASGAIDLRVQPLGQGSNLVVRTPYLDARVVGTEFRVMTDGSGSWVGVKAGRVEVVRTRANGEVVLLEPGYFASATRGWPPVTTADPNWLGKCKAFTGSPKYP